MHSRYAKNAYLFVNSIESIDYLQPLIFSGIVALNSMIDRLKEDHTNAQILANGLKKIPGININPEKLPTNLVFFDLLVPDPKIISDELNKIGIKGGKADKRWRFVTHSDISSEDIYFALNSLSDIMKKHYKSIWFIFANTYSPKVFLIFHRPLVQNLD